MVEDVFKNALKKYLASNRALQTWHKLRPSEKEVLEDFVAWLDLNSEREIAEKQGAMKISGFSTGDYGFLPGPLLILNSGKDIELCVGDEILISINKVTNAANS